MKKTILTVLLAAVGILCAEAQERMTVCVADPEGLPTDNAANMLKANLEQALELNDAAAEDSRFVMQANTSVLSKDVTTTAPRMFVTELEISVSIADTVSGDILAQTIFTVKGVADNDKASYLDAVKKIKARDPKLRKLITQAGDYFYEHLYGTTEKP